MHSEGGGTKMSWKDACDLKTAFAISIDYLESCSQIALISIINPMSQDRS